MDKNAHAFEVVADGENINISATVFAETSKEAHRVFWELLGDGWYGYLDQSNTASLEVVWDYADGVHPFVR